MIMGIAAPNPVQAWRGALSVLSDAPGHRLLNLAVEIADPTNVDPRHGRMVDAIRGARGNATTERVAATILPRSVLAAEDWMAAASRVLPKTGPKSYFRRMVDYGDPGKTNQLARVITELGRERKYVDPGPIVFERPSFNAQAHIGFPCLSAIQFHRTSAGQLETTAVYRSHYYHSKAYGNFVGLGRLAELVAREGGLSPGRLFVLSTDARLEQLGPMRTLIRILADEGAA